MSSTGPRLRYRTPADIRAIPNGQWEQWVLARDVPWGAFSAERGCQTVLRLVLRATARRMLAVSR